MKSKVRILCVGIGGYAVIYLRELLQTAPREDVEIVGMVEAYPENCTLYPTLKERGVPLYPDMESFYREHTADLAIITTPTHLHTRHILCALAHGSNVMCEKPLCGVSSDETLLSEAAKKAEKFVMIGYQWSYSSAILAMKQDILAGRYGKPCFLKSMVLWPRPISYYTRGCGWGGKLRTPEGDVLNDSVVSNATAHYLHNMLYVTGAGDGLASEVTSLECDLLRINAIETFDTAALRFKLSCGAEGLFIASHATESTLEPIFDYRFEKGTIIYRDEEKDIVGHLADGSTVHYGNPFHDVNEKIYIAIDAAKSDLPFSPVCGIATAAPQVRAVEMLMSHPVHQGKNEKIDRTDRSGSTFLSLRGLDTLLKACYERELLPSDCTEFSTMIET